MMLRDSARRGCVTFEARRSISLISAAAAFSADALLLIVYKMDSKARMFL